MAIQLRRIDSGAGAQGNANDIGGSPVPGRLDVCRGLHQPFGEQKADGQIDVIARRPHGYGDVLLALLPVDLPGRANLQRLLDRQDVVIVRGRLGGHPGDINRRDPLLWHGADCMAI